MKKKLQLFRARWLLLVTMLLCVLGASAQDTWYLFDDYIKDGKPVATFSDPDADGNYVTTFVPGLGNSNTYAFVNSINPNSDRDNSRFLGCASGNVTVSEPGTYDLMEIDFSTLWSVQKVFTLTDTWVVTFNPTTMKVTFEREPVPELPEEAPATLYFVDYNQSYASANNDGNGVFEFKGIELAANRYPNYGFCDTSNPRQATVMASAVPDRDATTANNVTIEMGQVYDLALSSWKAIDEARGTFIVNEGFYNITVDWKNRTVKFSEGTDTLPEAPETLYLVDWTKSFGEATNNGSGVFVFEGVSVSDNQYPYYGFANSSVPNAAGIVVGPVKADKANSTNNVIVELDETYPVALSNYDAINNCWGSYKIAEGLYDITLDWNAMTVTFTKGTVKMPEAPETLYLVDWNNSYGEATNDGSGVYVFEAVSVPSNPNPYYGFANSLPPSGADIIVSAAAGYEASKDNNVNVEAGEAYPIALSDYDAINGEKGCYVIPQGIYDITLDWNNLTVQFTKSVIKAPDTLYIIDYQKSFGSATNNGDGIYEFEDVVLTSSYPYYGFAPTDVISNAPWALGTVDYETAQSGGSHAYNVDVVYGEEYTFEFSNPQAMYDEKGSFVLSSKPVNITLDWNKRTVKFWLKPLEQPNTLYATDTYLEDLLGSTTNNGFGQYNMVVNVTKSSSIVVFTNNTDFKNANGETLYYGTDGDRVNNVEFEQAYPLAQTDYATVWADGTGLKLNQGRYKIDVDFVENTMVVHDISRGDVWTIPETLNVYNDEMELVATGNRTEEGVFEFENVAITKSTNVVFTDDPTATGKFFGSSMNGERSIDVKNCRTYELYIPTYQEILIDGVAGFRLPEGNWNIKVDMNEKNVTFVDPNAVYFPEQMTLVADAQVTSNVSEGDGNYVWKLPLTQETAVTFVDQLSGRTYGSPVADVTVEAGTDYDAAELAEEALNAFTVPAGTWEVVYDLKNGKITFYEYQSIKLVESTHNTGDKFYSYYGAGTEPVMTMTFSGNPYTIKEAFLALGDYTPGMTADTETCKIEKINVYRSGNTFITSFGGKTRAIPEGAEPKVTFVLSTIKSVHGLLAETEAIEGLPAGSLMFTFDFEDFEPVTIESMLLDENGNALDKEAVLNVDDKETVTLMVKPYNLITFDGVNLTADTAVEAENTTADTIALDWEAGEENSEGFTPITVNVPMSIRGTGKWYLTLANLNVDDNTDAHGDEVNYAIETLVNPADVVTADPANGSTVDVLHEITLTWDHAIVKSVGYKSADEPDVTVTDANGETYAAKLRVLSSINDNQLFIQTESEIVKAGHYTLVIPAGEIILNDDNETNANAIELEYTVTGEADSISNILANDPDAEVIVCTISGVVLRKGRAADVLKNLGEGIYIINGVKTLIRK